ncbi:hypothetical protein BJ508DRAFT_376801 [Ascobolus immersus RN42]|uniref:Uncharacterized protein n=1 Tax=Ascobolus immersus RN42 TaxID=1160509 RepID=A0A3N4I409_ASCIM|nr:hypothetical protein BJ508DRAFT_376801 [Ascobolus immersus RN42]
MATSLTSLPPELLLQITISTTFDTVISLILAHPTFRILLLSSPHSIFHGLLSTELASHADPHAGHSLTISALLQIVLDETLRPTNEADALDDKEAFERKLELYRLISSSRYRLYIEHETKDQYETTPPPMTPHEELDLWLSYLHPDRGASLAEIVLKDLIQNQLTFRSIQHCFIQAVLPQITDRRLHARRLVRARTRNRLQAVVDKTYILQGYRQWEVPTSELIFASSRREQDELSIRSASALPPSLSEKQCILSGIYGLSFAVDFCKLADEVGKADVDKRLDVVPMDLRQGLWGRYNDFNEPEAVETILKFLAEEVRYGLTRRMRLEEAKYGVRGNEVEGEEYLDDELLRMGLKGVWRRHGSDGRDGWPGELELVRIRDEIDEFEVRREWIPSHWGGLGRTEWCGGRRGQRVCESNLERLAEMKAFSNRRRSDDGLVTRDEYLDQLECDPCDSSIVDERWWGGSYCRLAGEFIEDSHKWLGMDENVRSIHADLCVWDEERLRGWFLKKVKEFE